MKLINAKATIIRLILCSSFSPSPFIPSSPPPLEGGGQGVGEGGVRGAAGSG
ncbi:hypothetical protein L4X63_15440 [Geomonas sp. Red32]|uniref:hypothetical protein n=1 Tax=Geomonas sp. Red32 TaxID=2912856 RepID=UPI00202CE3FD|nr:hypothetical protein [Geomonas sp. Red32]MCM0082986.1 hypothetical protein [Geomonas sp. Red32]